MFEKWNSRDLDHRATIELNNVFRTFVVFTASPKVTADPQIVIRLSFCGAGFADGLSHNTFFGDYENSLKYSSEDFTR